MLIKANCCYSGKDLEAMSFAVNYHKWIVDEFGPFLGDSVAEVGAGTGSVSKLLLEKPIKRLLAFEPSANMYPLLEELIDDVRAELFNDFFDLQLVERPLDSVVYINVLEHINDDVAELAKALKALKPTGHVLLFVPALPRLYSSFDAEIGHFRRYKKNDLIDLVTRIGFRVVKARYFDFAGIIPWYINFVLFQGSLGAARTALYDRFVVPLVRIVETVVAPFIGKNVMLIGEKPKYI